MLQSPPGPFMPHQYLLFIYKKWKLAHFLLEIYLWKDFGMVRVYDRNWRVDRTYSLLKIYFSLANNEIVLVLKSLSSGTWRCISGVISFVSSEYVAISFKR